MEPVRLSAGGRCRSPGSDLVDRLVGAGGLGGGGAFCLIGFGVVFPGCVDIVWLRSATVFSTTEIFGGFLFPFLVPIRGVTRMRKSSKGLSLGNVARLAIFFITRFTLFFVGFLALFSSTALLTCLSSARCDGQKAMHSLQLHPASSWITLALMNSCTKYDPQ